MTFRNLLEKTEYAIYYVADELWLARGQGSGQTIQLPDLKKYLNSDKNDSEHYNSSIDKILKYTKFLEPLKKTSNTELFEIPSYPSLRGNYNESYDIWGGSVKPISKIYMIVTKEKSTIVNFFRKKNEALAWMRSV